MTNNVTYNGVTYDLDFLSANGGRGYSASTVPGTGSTAKPFCVAVMEDALADAGKALVTTSVTSITIGTGTHVFTMGTSIPYKTGALVRVSDRAAPTTNYMIGTVTADATTTVSVIVAGAGVFGSGTISDWSLGITGETGVAGTFDIDGLTGVTVPAAADTIGIYDDSVSANRKITHANLLSLLTGAMDAADNVVSRQEIKDYAETLDMPTSASNVLVTDIVDGNVFEVQLTENVTTWTISNPSATGRACSFTLLLKQDGTGGWTFAFPASIKWPSGVAPTLSTGASDVDVMTFFTTDGGTIWYGFLAGADMS